MQKDETIQAALDLASDATALSAGLLLLLWRQGLLPADAIPHYDKMLRKIARDMERHGCDQAATELWTAANLLGHKPKSGQG